MTDNQKTTGVSVWGMFKTAPSVDEYRLLRDRARQAALNFDFVTSSMRSEDQDLTPHGKIEELDKWVASPDGRATLLHLTHDLQRRIRAAQDVALPAHDLRQILYKDTCEGLRFAEHEEPQGYKATFLIPMFTHDIGRLLEGKFYHLNIPPQQWIPHSQLSFLMLREVLDEYPEIPQRLKEHYLYAVLAHSGENGKTYMSRAVQTCDRMQMIGPEGFFRAISFMVALMPHGQLAYPREDRYKSDLPSLWDHKSVVSVMEHVGRNMYPNIGDRHKDWQDYMMQLNTGLLYEMAAQSPDLKASLFAPEHNLVPQTSLGHLKPPFQTAHMMAAVNLVDMKRSFTTATKVTTEATLVESILQAIEGPPGAARVTDEMEQRIRSAVKALSPDELLYISAGVNFALREQRELDREDDKLIARIGFSHDASPIAMLMAQAAQRFTREGVLLTGVAPALVPFPRHV